AVAGRPSRLPFCRASRERIVSGLRELRGPGGPAPAAGGAAWRTAFNRAEPIQNFRVGAIVLRPIARNMNFAIRQACAPTATAPLEAWWAHTPETGFTGFWSRQSYQLRRRSPSRE